MCCGIGKKKGTKPNELASTRKRSAQTGKYSGTKKSYTNGKKSS